MKTNAIVELYRGRTWWQRLLGHDARSLGLARVLDVDTKGIELDARAVPAGTEVVVILRRGIAIRSFKARGVAVKADRLTLRWTELPFEALRALRIATYAAPVAA